MIGVPGGVVDLGGRDVARVALGLGSEFSDECRRVPLTEVTRRRWRADGGCQPMISRDSADPGGFPVIAMVCSAGGLAALTAIIQSLPADLPAAVIVLQHSEPQRRSLLPTILQRHTAIPVARAEDGDALVPGRVLAAPEGAHLVVCPDGRIRLVSSDHAPRPSADLLLCTLATSMGSRAIAVILTGTGHDGATGALAVAQLGGTTFVEDPSTAHSRGMPDAAIFRQGPVTILPQEKIATALQGLVRQPRPHSNDPATSA